MRMDSPLPLPLSAPVTHPSPARVLGEPAPARWFLPGRPRREARHQLFCFHYAGGGASAYATWQALLPATVEVWRVELPGRQTRAGEPFARALDGMALEIAQAMRPLLRTDYSLLGCSMGAVLAFEVARQLEADPSWAPRRLFAVSSNPPRSHGAGSALHRLADDALLEAVALHYEAIPAELLAEPKLRETVLRVLRADLALIETHRCAASARLRCPISLFVGTRDRTIALDALAGWRERTHDELEHAALDGGHFLVHGSARELMPRILRRLS